MKVDNAYKVIAFTNKSGEKIIVERNDIIVISGEGKRR